MNEKEDELKEVNTYNSQTCRFESKSEKFIISTAADAKSYVFNVPKYWEIEECRRLN